MTTLQAARAAAAGAGARADLRIDGQRLWDTLMRLAAIGATPKGGVCRLALTDLDRQGRDFFVAEARAAGCTIRVDAIGNIFARRAGRDDALPPVMTGSHIDTQPTGGKFDGNYGVFAGIEVLRTLADAGIVTDAPLEVAVWTNEEGSRFVPVMMGSGAFIGEFALAEVLQQRDRDGISVGQALQAIGYAGPEPVGARPVGAYFEAHIEQGPVLEANDTTIGVVTGALGQRWYDVVLTGMEAHAGPTPMALRKDALLAASELVGMVNRIALDHPPHGRGTVGCLAVHPDSRNVIPGKVTMTVDLRAGDDTVLSAMDAALRAQVAALAARSGIDIELRQVVYFPPQPFDGRLVEAVRGGARRLGHAAMEVISGAGHDAVYLARVAPAAMIFVPCKDGISHNEIEEARPEHLEAGCNVLLHAMLDAATRP
ncbi:Zn-dependent hydrolase [Cupriavidus taiwanensis]|uniref:Zn-dependent hydrolase n=1 Tax=Cupriavidus taiwanensis TaxID=164546 RepID=UPI000E1089C1|nr:Zn-dependent hydrolase [Cupriavidus taiwanensis]SOY64989.1 Amidase, hydantoinase/carbamoylase, N-carbamoyl-L-amino-acid hydrolase [Cupriavidus taiwanensis]SOY65284.1 Amidase, hydantoinase/carbamoylase, N-carbamoyl-L-amino-acid hydrolase [Cupriavidus taiwanensis]SOY94118.1 Amidase, hydantoinase/carbamoylase, N-carbamoyl-L-amino-acid hydrolase [Cupriavidus taiwanensis]SOZ69361.1 Amidase, hydantoinase/carbamoylase, N-carbamoyl-L-amino-acid hydrolase [Cupriavidus taiwanensis]SOZ85759.1 Amidase,